MKEETKGALKCIRIYLMFTETFLAEGRSCRATTYLTFTEEAYFLGATFQLYGAAVPEALLEKSINTPSYQEIIDLLRAENTGPACSTISLIT